MKEEKRYYVYILTNKSNKVLYTGITNSLLRRIFQHKLKESPSSFTAKYNTNKLVYYEIYQNIQDAIEREKEIKRYRRQWKLDLIIKFNPTWQDFFEEIL